VIVVDASALIEVLLNTSRAARIAARLFASTETLHAPHLIDLEVAQVLRRYAAVGELDDERGARALEDLADMPLRRCLRGKLIAERGQLLKRKIDPDILKRPAC
jgi:predicted nucleic acid-binding protein